MGVKTILLLLLGGLCLAIGAVGAVLPVLPTTPFVLLAAGCFGGSSPRLYRRLAGTKYFGAFLANYKTGGGVARQVKVRALIFLWLALTPSILLVTPLWLKALLVLVGLAVTAHILLMKHKSA